MSCLLNYIYYLMDRKRELKSFFKDVKRFSIFPIYLTFIS